MTNIILFLKQKLPFLLIFFVFVSAAFAGGYIFHRQLYREAPAELKKTSRELKTFKSEYDKLKETYKNLEADRDNVLTQTKRLIQDKNRLTDLEDKYAKLAKKQQDILLQSQKAALVYQKTKRKRDELAKSLEEEHLRIQWLESENQKFSASIQELQKNLDAKIEKSPEFKRLKEELATIKKEKTSLERDWKESDGTIKQLRRELGEAQLYKQKHAELTEEVQRLKEEKKELVKNLEDTPKKFKELASENRTLIKETANMHYNLGNFYAENKRFDRAVEEYKKTVDLNPTDGRAHYNLGYIYAEEFQNHDKAQEHFRKYLGIDPEDESVDWVRNYLLTQGTFDGDVFKS